MNKWRIDDSTTVTKEEISEWDEWKKRGGQRWKGWRKGRSEKGGQKEKKGKEKIKEMTGGREWERERDGEKTFGAMNKWISEYGNRMGKI